MWDFHFLSQLMTVASNGHNDMIPFTKGQCPGNADSISMSCAIMWISMTDIWHISGSDIGLTPNKRHAVIWITDDQSYRNWQPKGLSEAKELSDQTLHHRYPKIHEDFISDNIWLKCLLHIVYKHWLYFFHIKLAGLEMMIHNIWSR